MEVEQVNLHENIDPFYSKTQEIHEQLEGDLTVVTEIFCRLCSYPQHITLQLVERSWVRKLQLLAHQYLIPTKVEFHIGDTPPDASSPGFPGQLRGLGWDCNLGLALLWLWWVHLAMCIKVKYSLTAGVCLYATMRIPVSKLGSWNQAM